MLSNKAKLALIDDHKLFRKGLASLIEVAGDGFEILFEADNGLDMQGKIDPQNQPDIILMDINMPVMDGFASVEWLNEHFPLIRVLVVSMVEKEQVIVKMLRTGVKGYLSKDVEPEELAKALNSIMDKGFYYTDFITGKLVHSLQQGHRGNADDQLKLLNRNETQFLKLACSEMTYQEIAAKMYLSPKTIDGYRNSLFEKLSIKSRVGLVLFAIRNELVIP